MGNRSIQTPHDRFFKSLMSEQKVIREFFEKNLPANIKAAVNFNTIAPQKESFVDDKLRLQVADLLFSAEFNNKPGYLYLLTEMQSAPDKLMPFRLIRYIIAIMEQHLKKGGDSKLPVVYPLVFYSGWRPYNYSTDLFDLFEENKGLAMDTLYKPFKLLDLSKISDEELRNYIDRGVILRVMKHVYEKNFLPTLRAIVKDLKQSEKNNLQDYIYNVLSYIVEAAEIPDKQEFFKVVSELAISEGNIMTLAEQFRQEGYQKGQLDGISQGIEKGIEKGKLEGKNEALKTVAMSLFGQGMTIKQIASITGLSVNETEQLKNESTS
jgi:predicted transposase/invertase (TIGR01784 family)